MVISSWKSIRRATAVMVGLTFWLPLLAQLPPPSACPQPRFTGKAPDEYYNLKTPEADGANDIKAGGRLYQGEAGSAAKCFFCHGKLGDGKGPLASQFQPPPRNFACAATIDGVPDGQLFWIIKFGSPGTGMPPHAKLADKEVYQLIAFIRQLAR